MRFFSEHLETAEDREIDISVHCDVKIFEWLLSYLQYCEYLRLVRGEEQGTMVCHHLKYTKG